MLFCFPKLEQFNSDVQRENGGGKMEAVDGTVLYFLKQWSYS